MAWYHVGGCDCPIGCCDCGDDGYEPQTKEETEEETVERILERRSFIPDEPGELVIFGYSNDECILIQLAMEVAWID